MYSWHLNYAGLENITGNLEGENTALDLECLIELVAELLHVVDGRDANLLQFRERNSF
ncbi:hypothetical protein AGMMS50249_1080 [candidate division SR1 bacterium]|nr:hypothetical protein AGMMS50249_1080 [candidate division SR1 bacterium]